MAVAERDWPEYRANHVVIVERTCHYCVGSKACPTRCCDVCDGTGLSYYGDDENTIFVEVPRG